MRVNFRTTSVMDKALSLGPTADNTSANGRTANSTDSAYIKVKMVKSARVSGLTDIK